MDEREPEKKQGDKLATESGEGTANDGEGESKGPSGAPTNADEEVEQGPSGPPPSPIPGGQGDDPDRAG